MFVVCLVPWLFTPFSDVVSLSQSRRLAGFVPFAFALAGGHGVLARLLGPLVVPLALVAGIVFQALHPGDFGYTLEDGGPAWATWVARRGRASSRSSSGFRQRPPLERTAALASGAPAAAGVRARARELVAVRRPAAEPALRRASLEAVRERVPAGAVVYSDREPSYRLGAYAPVRVC